VHFEFIPSPSFNTGEDEFVLNVPKDIQSKDELLVELAKAGNFPEYFGGNWDALLDCLRDFEWIRQKTILIVHRDLPLHTSPEDCLTYLEILDVASNDRNQNSNLAFPEHKLRVIFSLSQRDKVLEVVANA